MEVGHAQAVRYRMAVNRLSSRLPPKSYEEAARFGLQDTYPRSALVSLHARVAGAEPEAWEDPGLIQTYSPRAAAYVLPRTDFGVFTIGRGAFDPDERRAVEERAERVCRYLDGRKVRGRDLPEDIASILRPAAASGRLAIRWDARSMAAFEIPRPEIDFDVARLELCRRHVHAFGPSTPDAFAWWAGITSKDAGETWKELSDELLPVDYEGRPAAILRADEEAMESPPEVDNVRLLPTEESKLLLLLAGSSGPRQKDTFHPHPLVVYGEVAGRWGRKQGRVLVKLNEQLPPETSEAIAAEALSMPIPNVSMSVEIVVEPGD